MFTRKFQFHERSIELKETEIELINNQQQCGKQNSQVEMNPTPNFSKWNSNELERSEWRPTWSWTRIENGATRKLIFDQLLVGAVLWKWNWHLYHLLDKTIRRWSGWWMNERATLSTNVFGIFSINDTLHNTKTTKLQSRTYRETGRYMKTNVRRI